MSNGIVVSCLETMHHRVRRLEADSEQVFIVGVKRDPETGQEYAAHMQDMTDDWLTGVLFVLRHSDDGVVLRANLEVLADHATEDFQRYYKEFLDHKASIPPELQKDLSYREQADLRRFVALFHKVPVRNKSDKLSTGLRYYAYTCFSGNPKLLQLCMNICETVQV